MAKLNREELSSLPLTERIRRLRQIESDSKKAIEEARKLIKETETEIRTSDVASAIAPEPERVDISKLFKQEEGLEGSISKKGSAEEENINLEYVRTNDQETAGYSSMAEEPQLPRQSALKIEEQTIYRAESKGITDKSVASKSVLEATKKYTRG